ncbi:MAG: ABC transporter permease [Candidatus Dormibacteria bacterium]
MSATVRPVGGLTWAGRDAGAMAKRNLRRMFRAPEGITFTLIQPVMFVLLFRYVFGGAIPIPGSNYVNFLIPGIAAQTAVFGASLTGVGLAEDLSKGFVDRLRSLPMARSAVLVGRLAADFVLNTAVLAVLLITGFLVGFRPQSIPGLLIGAVLLLGFSLSISCMMACLGLALGKVEAVQAASFPIIFPFTFASSAFVPVQTMPGWLQVFAQHQPFTVVVDAVRSLTAGDISVQVRQALFNGATTAELIVQSLAWTAGFILVFGFLAVRSYRRIT